MADPYVAPTDPEERMIEIALDPWVTWSRYTLWFCGLVYGLFGIGLGPLMSTTLLVNPDVPDSVKLGFTLGFSLFSLVLCGGFGLLNFVAAAGIGRGAKWGWILTLIVGALYLPSACLPFGGILMYGMLNDRTRKLFNP